MHIQTLGDRAQNHGLAAALPLCRYLWDEFGRNETPIDNKSLKQPASIHRSDHLFQPCEKLHTLIGTLKSAKPRFYVSEITIKNPRRQNSM
jgi:hypothetical protein